MIFRVAEKGERKALFDTVPVEGGPGIELVSLESGREHMAGLHLCAV